MRFDDRAVDERLPVSQSPAYSDKGFPWEPLLKRIGKVALVHPLRFSEARLLIGMLAVVVTFVAACGPSSGSATAPGATAAATTSGGANSGAAASAPAAPAAASVSMTDALRFEPATLTVRKGATVTWTNGTSTVHTVTDDPSKAVNKADAALPSGAQSWDSGNLNPGQTFKHTFDTPGTYKYFCGPHESAGMVASITVTG